MHSLSFPTRVEINGYKILNNIILELTEKNILYGINGVGKSSILEVISFLYTNMHVSKVDLYIHSDDFRISYNFPNRVVEILYEKEKYKLKENGVSLLVSPEFLPIISETRHRLGITETAVWVNSCSLYREGGESINICHGDIRLEENLFKDPTVFDIFKKILRNLLDISDVSYINGNWWVKEKGRWIKINELAYGIKRAMMTIIATLISDVIFIEAFEAGFHGDLILVILDYLSESGKHFVIETHNGLAVSYGVSKGWRTFYIDEESNVTVIESVEDLIKADLFEKELKLYQF